jgi:transcription elongation factor GreA
MAELTYLTAEGLERLKKELIEMRTKGRAEIARQIQEAREKGDLSENAEYDAAKDAQGMLEMKIAKLEEALANARILDTSKYDTSKVMVMSKVKVKNLQNKQTILFMLVSEKEADLKSGKISVSSPIGKGLLGKSVGEVTEISVPSGTMKLEVLEISI